MIECKVCSKCKQDKLLSDFGKNRLHLDGLQKRCKVCRNLEAAEFRKKYPERKKASDKKSYIKNRESKLFYQTSPTLIMLDLRSLLNL